MPPKKKRKFVRKLDLRKRSVSFHSDDSNKAAEEIREILEKANVIPSGEYALNPSLKVIRDNDTYFTPIRTVTFGGKRNTRRKKRRRKRKTKRKKRRRKRKTKKRRK